MGNSLIEGVVNLSGSGFSAKENGNFQPGEYKRLSNIEIDRSGFLINRRNVYSPYGQNSGQAVSPITNVQRFLGNMGEYTLFTNGSKQWMIGANSFTEIWSSLVSPGTGSSFARLVGFFRYNNRNNWLVLEFKQGVSIGLSLYQDASIPVPDVPSTYAPGYETSLTRTVIFTFAAGSTDFYDFQFKNFFIYKERLWIATSVGLYFSKATDPSVFTAPSGGFFKHPGNRVNWAFAIKDSIYTLCQDAVYALNYNTDPNTDATERPLSDTIGGEMGCIHLDTPYFINNLGIFAINGNNVDKVMDSKFDYGKDTYANRIWSFENYLVVNKYLPINYDNNYSPPNRSGLRTQLWTSPESDTVGGSQILTGWTQQNSGTKVRKNDVPNPTMGDVITNSWYINNFSTSISRATTVGRSDSNSLALSPSVGGTVDLSCNSGNLIGATALSPHTLSAYVRLSATFNVEMQLQWRNAGNNIISVDSATVNVNSPNVWTRISITRTAPANATNCTLIFTVKSVLGGTQYIDDILFEQTDQVRSYFDGSFANSSFDSYTWLGSPHYSGSTKTITTVIPNAAASFADGQPGKVLKFSGQVNAYGDYDGTISDFNSVWTKYTYTLTPSSVAALAPYTFRCDYRLEAPVGASAASLTLLVEYLDATSTVLSSTSFNVNTALVSTSGYQTTTVEVVPPANTTSFRFTFQYFNKSNTGIQSYALHFNRFHLERSNTYSGYFSGASTGTASIAYNWTGVAYGSTSTASPDTHGYLKNNGSMFPPFREGNSLGYNTYFINTENGSTHVLDFMDQFSNVSESGAGFIVDAITNPFKDNSGNYKWVFITNKLISQGSGGLTYSAYPYYISSSEDSLVNDFAVDSGNILRRRAPKIDVEIDSYVPDGLEYRIKRFRSLLLQGIIPPTGLQLDVAYDNSGYVQSTSLGDNEIILTTPRRHYAHRIGLNQRGHSITLRLYNPLWSNPISAAYGDTEISDLRALWTYSARLPVTKSIGS